MDATEYLLRRLERVSIHLRALEEQELSTDVDMGIAKIKELTAKVRDKEAKIAELLGDDGK